MSGVQRLTFSAVAALIFSFKVEDFENLSRLWAAVLAGRWREQRARPDAVVLVDWNPQFNKLKNACCKNNTAQN